MSRLSASLSLLLPLLLLLACAHAPAPADLVLLHGELVTMNPRQPRAQALAMRGQLIVAVGSDAEVRRLVSARTRVIDLKGRLAIPGLIESHGHLMALGEQASSLDLGRARSWAELVASVQRAAREVPAGQWIVGRGWHQERWSTPPQGAVSGLPTHHALSQAVPRHPVLLVHASGHLSLANARALALARVDARTPDPAGGEILRDARGQPTGVLRETAAGLVQAALNRVLAARSPAQVEADQTATLARATRACLAHGVTSFHDAGVSLGVAALYRKLALAGKLGLRLYVMLNAPDRLLGPALARQRAVGLGGKRLTIRAIKRLADGALGSHGAWLLAPYADQPARRGLNVTPMAQLERTARLALKHGFQLCTHAIGDRANREVLDLYQRVLGRQSKAARWRVEHAQHLHPDDIPRFAKLGVIAAMQGVHCTSDGPWVPKRLGQDRSRRGAYAWRALLDSGAVVANGTDTPVEAVDPMANFHALITRRMASGETFFADQRMTRLEALRSYTLHAAHAAFEEQDKGSLELGKLADVVVLSRDIMRVPAAQIPGTRVLYTIIGGQVVYQAR